MQKSLSRAVLLFIFFIGGLSFIALLPPFILLGKGIVDSLTVGPTVTNTIIANGLAFSISVLSMSRFERYPQRKLIAFVLPITATVYSLLMVVFLVLRIPYSIKIIFIGLLCLPLLLGLQHLLSGRGRQLKFLTLPFGDALDLESSRHYHFSKLTKPGIKPQGVDGLVIDFKSASLTPEWEAFVSDCALGGLPVFSATQLKESILGRVNISHLIENNFGILAPSPVIMFVKRVIDVFVVLLSFPVVLPICLLTAIIIAWESEGDVLFIQQRVGFRGKIFSILKFRSMNAPDIHSNNPPEGLEFDRITPVGRVIRKYRIDELPQLWNVLKGDLSLIGPRPESVQWVDRYRQEIPFYPYRNIIKPGITGWAQVMQGHVHGVEDTKRKLEYDLYYVKHFSLWLDLLIVYKTIRTVVMAIGSR